MKIQLIRNATMKITYAGCTFLTDPMLSDKGALRSFAGIAPNPTVDLPADIEEIIQGIDAVIISHLHPDHFDAAAARTLPKSIKIFCQPEDAATLKESGFTDIAALDTVCAWHAIDLTRTGGKHGSGKILQRLGQVSGFVFKAEGEPVVYWVGDSIYCREVTESIEGHNPDIIITHSGGATLPGFAPIIMDGEQTLMVLDAAPNAVVVAVHMESLDHCTVSRTTLRDLAKTVGIAQSRLVIPDNGGTVTF
jgi:L-ascorbate metabolism protein UlaG (beta-lactamase superfamily)